MDFNGLLKPQREKKVRSFCAWKPLEFITKTVLLFSERKYKTPLFCQIRRKHYLISLGLKSKNDSIDVQRISQNGCRTIWQNYSNKWVKFFCVSYTRQYQEFAG
jgi:hypothetical protein